MTTEERSRLEAIDRIVRSNEVRREIQPIIERVSKKLASNSHSVMAWEPIPLEIFGRGLPESIRSGWIFILRRGADTGPERHPNSHQRMLTLSGTGDMRTKQRRAWKSNILRSNRNARLRQRWVSIPQNTWHQPVVGAESDWAVISFHTVPAEELIEERPGPSTASANQQMKYLDA